MDINDILKNLGLDFTDPETKRGALEALDAILASRQPPQSFGSSNGSGNSSGDNDDEEDIEVDPDLLQPSQKHAAPDVEDDIEIEDEEDLLSQIKQNDSESDTPSSGSNQNTEKGSEQPGNVNDNTAGDSNSDDTQADTEDSLDSENNDSSAGNEGSEEASTEAEQDDSKQNKKTVDTTEDDFDNSAEALEDSDDAEDFDETDLLDDSVKNIFNDEGIKAKQEARKIKRERTLQAAKKALSDAQKRRAAQPLIRELEQAIAALEELTEAVKKNIADISDDEFNLLINRVFDAIDAVGDTSLTFSSDEEREVRAKEIKNDLSSSRTQNELSAEDVAQIRAENQAIKARERETNKYKGRSVTSFKGFQDFLNSLYRAVALQVHVDETQDDTWSAINRRHSGSGVLQPGKKIQELPNKKIPIIDFYFDCSGSWEDEDIAIGQKAVSKLAEMEANGQIKINIYYFSNDVFSDIASARSQGGTRAWNDIVKNVIATQATNVIIMTDSDMDTWWKGPTALSYTVPGYVWYLWRDGDNAPRLPRDLKGRGGTQQFSFSRNDL